MKLGLGLRVKGLGFRGIRYLGVEGFRAFSGDSCWAYKSNPSPIEGWTHST